MVTFNTETYLRLFRATIDDWLSRVGGYVLQSARRRMKVSPHRSRPGHAPHLRRETSALRTAAEFTVLGHELIVGPMDFGTDVPAILEFGGQSRHSDGRPCYIAPRPVWRSMFDIAVRRVDPQRSVRSVLPYRFWRR